MDQQRLMRQGLLSEQQQSMRELEARAENIIAALQSASFVLDSPLDLDADKIVTAAGDLAAVIKQGAIVRAKIEELKDSLGIR